MQECIFLDIPQYSNMTEIIFKDSQGKFFFYGDIVGTGFLVQVYNNNQGRCGLVLTYFIKIFSDATDFKIGLKY